MTNIKNAQWVNAAEETNSGFDVSAHLKAGGITINNEESFPTLIQTIEGKTQVKNNQVVEFVKGIADDVKIKPHCSNKFCSPRWLELNPARGCQFQCQYCYVYTHDKVKEFDKITVYQDYPEYLESFIRNNQSELDKFHFYCAPQTDILQDCLIESGITERILEILNNYGAKYYLFTKGKTPPLNIQKLLIDAKDRNQIVVSCAMATEEIREKIEPYAPTIAERMAFAKFGVDNGIFTTATFYPMFPIANMDYIEKYIDTYIDMGVKHFQLGFADLPMDSIDRLIELVPEYDQEMRDEYFDPNALVTKWNISGDRVSDIEFYRPSVQHMSAAFNRFKEYAKWADPAATVSICGSLCTHECLAQFNKDAKERGLSCMGTRVHEDLKSTL